MNIVLYEVTQSHHVHYHEIVQQEKKNMMLCYIHAIYQVEHIYSLYLISDSKFLYSMLSLYISSFRSLYSMLYIQNFYQEEAYKS